MRTFVIVCTIGFLSATAVQRLRDRLRRDPIAPSILAAEPLPDTSAVTGVALQAGRNGHVFVDASIDGRALSMMIDTGANSRAFSEEDAARIGIRVVSIDFKRVGNTANGTVRVAPIRIGVVQIGSIAVRDVDAVVIFLVSCPPTFWACRS